MDQLGNLAPWGVVSIILIRELLVLGSIRDELRRLIDRMQRRLDRDP